MVTRRQTSLKTITPQKMSATSVSRKTKLKPSQTVSETSLKSNSFKDSLNLLNCAILFFCFFVLYTLSIGPLFWTWYDGYVMEGSSLIVLFYEPLLWCCEIDLIGDWVNTYIELWI